MTQGGTRFWLGDHLPASRGDAVLPVVPYTEQTAYGQARIWAEVQAVGKMAGSDDLIVGAAALERGSQVATFNRRHFDPVPGLTVIEPN